MCVRHGGSKRAGTEKASAAKARGVGDGKCATQPFSQGARHEHRLQEQQASLCFLAYANTFRTPARMCFSVLSGLSMAHVRFKSTVFNFKYYLIFEMFAQADVVGRTAMCYKV